MTVAFKDIKRKGVAYKIKFFKRYYFWVDTYTSSGFVQLGRQDGYGTITDLRKDLHTIITSFTKEGKSYFITKSVPIIHYAKNNHLKEYAKDAKKHASD